jgi:hypothetical protein
MICVFVMLLLDLIGEEHKLHKLKEITGAKGKK